MEDSSEHPTCFFAALLEAKEHGHVSPHNAPNAALGVGVHNLPNLWRELLQCCFQSVHGSQASCRNNDPVVHVLSKAWPMRCSIRNFSDIVSGYATRDARVCDALVTMLCCTLMSSYPHSSFEMSRASLLNVYRYLIQTPPTPTQFASWIKNAHQHILFVAIKEYIVFLVGNVPSLSAILREKYPWASFVDSVVSQSDYIRKQYDSNVRLGSMPFASIQDGITCIKSFKCRSGLHLTKMSHLEFLAMFRMPASEHNLFNVPLRTGLFHLLKPGQSLCNVLKQCRVLKVAEACAGVTAVCDLVEVPDKHKLKAAWESLAAQDRFLVGEVMHAFVARACVRCVALPSFIRRMQESAMAQHPRQTSVYFCVCCKQIRSFVVDDSTASKHAWARGNSKVVYDDVSGNLYCGKKIEKTNPAHRSGACTQRNYWKNQQSFMCRYSRLVRVDMLGALLQVNNCVHILCPTCLCVMVCRADRFVGSSIMCIHCQYRQTTAATRCCYHCYTWDVAGGVQVPIRGVTRALCKKCCRPWMQKQDVLQRISDATLHRAINERWNHTRVLSEL